MSGFGFRRDIANSRLIVEVAGTGVIQATTTAVTIPAAVTSGLTIVAGGLAVTAGGLTITAGGLTLVEGRFTELLTVVDDNTQNMTLAVADIVAGINVHTTTSSGGAVTTDTGGNIIAGIPLTANNQCFISYYINDGNQTATFGAGDGNITIADAGNTVLAAEAAVLLWRRVTSTTVVLYIVTS